MPAFFSLIFTFILLVVAFLICWAIWSLIAPLIARHKAIWIVAGVPVSILAVLGGAVGLYVWSNRPATIFAQEFGFAPTPDVHFVRGEQFSMGDSGSAHLQFTAAPTTIARCVAGAGLTRSSPPSFGTNARPAWFAPPPTASVAYVRNVPRAAGGFASEMRILKVDPTTGAAWYEFGGVD